MLLKQLGPALEKQQRRSIDVEVTNTDRSFGTIFGSEITKKYGGEGLPEDTFIVKCSGAGGQSFGAFIPKGLTLELVGDSNDYFGKGLSGGKLVVYAPAGVQYKKMRISSLVTWLFTGQPVEKHLSVVLQASVSVSVTPVHPQLLRESAIMDVSI